MENQGWCVVAPGRSPEGLFEEFYAEYVLLTSVQQPVSWCGSLPFRVLHPYCFYSMGPFPPFPPPDRTLHSFKNLSSAQSCCFQPLSSWTDMPSITVPSLPGSGQDLERQTSLYWPPATLSKAWHFVHIPERSCPGAFGELIIRKELFDPQRTNPILELKPSTQSMNRLSQVPSDLNSTDRFLHPTNVFITCPPQNIKIKFARQMYISDFRIFTKLWNYHHYLILCSQHPKRYNTHVSSHSSPALSNPHHWAPCCLETLPLQDTLYTWDHPVCGAAVSFFWMVWF